MAENNILGIDVGASGIKGAIVNIDTGELISERFRLDTPKPALPEAMAATFAEVVKHFDWKGKVGCGFPAVIKNGVAYTASNIDKKWIGTNAEQLFSKYAGVEVSVLNDADAAGVAEMEFGDAKGEKGTVILITVGSGLGSALFTDGHLVANTELGHFTLKNQVAEHYASDATRKKEDLSWTEWALRFNDYIEHVEKLFYPNLIIIGGGASKKIHRYEEVLKSNCKVIPASLRNNAGIVGAALYANKKVFDITVKDLH